MSAASVSLDTPHAIATAETAIHQRIIAPADQLQLAVFAGKNSLSAPSGNSEPAAIPQVGERDAVELLFPFADNARGFLFVL